MVRPQNSSHSTPQSHLQRTPGSGSKIYPVGNGNPVILHHQHGDGPTERMRCEIEEEDEDDDRLNHNEAPPPAGKIIPHQESPVTTNLFNHDSAPDDLNLFDSLFTEGFSEAKRKALDAFIKSYKSFDKLKNIQENLSAKRSEVESIENLLRRNHANLNNLKVVMLSSEGGGEEEDMFMKEAVESQTLSIQKQERQLHNCREEMKQIESNLKSLYAQLMCDFEKHWQSMKNFRMKAGIPPEIDFTEIMSQSPQPQDGKPVMEVTKGIVKGVGGVRKQRRYAYIPKE